MLNEAEAEVLLGCPVAKIKDADDHVEVVTRTGDNFVAEVAVVALPANAWGRIAFTPELDAPRLAAAEQGLASTEGIKVWLHVRGLDQHVYAQLPSSEPLFSLWTYAELDDGQLLVAFGADPALDVADERRIRSLLSSVLPEAELVRTHAHDWVADEFSQGAWSSMRTGQLTQLLPGLLEPLGRLTFATSDIAKGWCGFIDGAIESGCTAARAAYAIASRERQGRFSVGASIEGFGKGG